MDVETNDPISDVNAIAADMLKGMQEEKEATAPPTPAPSAPQAIDDVDEPAEDSGGKSGQPAKSDDPYATLRELGSPEEIKAAIEEAKNAKAMRREAHFRNENASKLAQRIEEAERRVNQVYEKNQQVLDAAALARKAGNDQYALQLLDIAASQADRDQPGTGPTQPQSNQQIAALQRQIEELRQQHQQYAFGDGHSRVHAAAIEAVERHPVFQNKELQKLGVPDKVVQNIVARVIQQANDDPNSVNVFDPRSYRTAVTKAMAAEASYYEQLGNSFVNSYRADRKAKNAQAPPSTRGASASVRGAPPQAKELSPNASQREVRDYVANELLRSMTSPNGGRATEV